MFPERFALYGSILSEAKHLLRDAHDADIPHIRQIILLTQRSLADHRMDVRAYLQDLGEIGPISMRLLPFVERIGVQIGAFVAHPDYTTQVTTSFFKKRGRRIIARDGNALPHSRAFETLLSTHFLLAPTAPIRAIMDKMTKLVFSNIAIFIQHLEGLDKGSDDYARCESQYKHFIRSMFCDAERVQKYEFAAFAFEQDDETLDDPLAFIKAYFERENVIDDPLFYGRVALLHHLFARDLMRNMPRIAPQTEEPTQLIRSYLDWELGEQKDMTGAFGKMTGSEVGEMMKHLCAISKAMEHRARLQVSPKVYTNLLSLFPHGGFNLLTLKAFWCRDVDFIKPNGNYSLPAIMIQNEICYASGPSGLTELYMMLMNVIGNAFSEEEMHFYLFFCSSYIVGTGLHSLHEILMVASDIYEMLPDYQAMGEHIGNYTALLDKVDTPETQEIMRRVWGDYIVYCEAVRFGDEYEAFYSQQRMTPLMLAIRDREKSLEPILELLGQNANPNDRDELGRTGLMLAVHQDDHAALDVLLSHGGDVHFLQKDIAGKTAVDYCRLRPADVPESRCVKLMKTMDLAAKVIAINQDSRFRGTMFEYKHDKPEALAFLTDLAKWLIQTKSEQRQVLLGALSFAKTVISAEEQDGKRGTLYAISQLLDGVSDDQAKACELTFHKHMEAQVQQPASWYTERRLALIRERGVDRSDAEKVAVGSPASFSQNQQQ